MKPYRLSDLRTPALLLERATVETNVARMKRRISDLGPRLRAHLKTAKSIDIAQMLIDPANPGVTVSTLREAEYFLERGVTDLFYAVGIAPEKLGDVADLQRRGADLKILLDHPRMAAAVAAEARSLGSGFSVLIEVDSDGHRAGVPPDSETLIEIANMLAEAPELEFIGVATHAGGSYASRSTGEISRFAQQERDRAMAAADRIRASGIPCPEVSVGSTPTATFPGDLAGVTEVRAGVFVFQDLYQAGLGVCELEDIAVSVLATVIGHRADLGFVIVDAGGLALSLDRSTARQPVDQGYGLVCDMDGGPLDHIVAAVNQEHGMIRPRSGEIDVDRFPLGSRVRILPNHACMTAAAHSLYQVLENGEVTAVWERCNGW